MSGAKRVPTTSTRSLLSHLGFLLVNLASVSKVDELNGRPRRIRAGNKKYILRFDVRVHDPTLRVQKLEGVEQLCGDRRRDRRLYHALELDQPKQRMS